MYIIVSKPIVNHTWAAILDMISTSIVVLNHCKLFSPFWASHSLMFYTDRLSPWSDLIYSYHTSAALLSAISRITIWGFSWCFQCLLLVSCHHLAWLKASFPLADPGFHQHDVGRPSGPREHRVVVWAAGSRGLSGWNGDLRASSVHVSEPG